MKITIRQLKTLIREAVHDEQFDQQFYDPKLGLEIVTTSREAANGTIALLDPETNEKYKITVPTRYLRVLRDPQKVQTSRHAIGLGMGNDNPARVLVSPKDVADDIEFIEVVRATITKIVNLHRKKLNDINIERDARKQLDDLRKEPNKIAPYITPEFQAQQNRLDYYNKYVSRYREID